MEWIFGILGAVIVAYVTAQFTARRERDNLRQELKLEYSIETAIIQLLGKQGWKQRSIKAIKRHIRGFADDELRQYLVRAGAVAFEGRPDPDSGERSKDPEEQELWGLLKNNVDSLAKKSETP